MSIPLEIRDQLAKAINSIEANKIGIEIVQEMLLQIINQVQGVYLMPLFEKYEAALRVLEVL